MLVRKQTTLLRIRPLKTTTPLSLLAVAIFSISSSVGTAHADLTLTSEDFTSSSITSSLRVFDNDADLGWHADFGTNSGLPSLWQISGGTLNNPATFDPNSTPPPSQTRDKPNEGTVGQLISVNSTDTTLNEIEFSFDYNVGTGTTLFFHAVGLVANTSFANANPQIFNTQAINGGTQDVQREANYTDISLFDGTDPNGGTNFAQALTGSGTFTGTFDLSQFASSTTTGITNVSDLDFVALAFGANVTDFTGAGAYSIDNFTVEAISAVPEPSSFAVFAIAMVGFGFRRRR